MNLSRYTKSELEWMVSDLNLTEDETIIYEMLSKGKSIIQIADRLNMSTRSVDRRIRVLKDKLNMG